MTEQRFVYLAHPIDSNGGDPRGVNAQIARVTQLLRDRGIGSYNPAHGWTIGRGMPPGPEINRVNHHAMSVSTGIIAWLPDRVRTIGVPIEIERCARGWGMPAAVLTDDTRSWSLYTSNSRVRLFDTGQGQIADVLEQAVDWLETQPAGVTPFDPDGGRRQATIPVSVEAGGRMPSRAYPDDAGMDLYCSATVKIDPGAFVDIPTGVRVAMPPEVWGMLTGRSSTLRKKGLLVNQGVIDPGYRGELYSGVWNLTEEVVEVRAGERIAQLILLSNRTRDHRLEWTQGLPASDRGVRGFGSSGA